jgi:tyrosine-specific transport protein
MKILGLIFLCAGTMIGSTVITLPTQLYRYSWELVFLFLFLLCIYSFFVSLYSVELISRDISRGVSKKNSTDLVHEKLDLSISNLSMKYLNNFAKSVCDICTTGLFFSLLCAYISGLSSMISGYFDLNFVYCVFLVSFTTVVIIFNNSYFMKVNNVFFIGKLLCFGLLIFASIKNFSMSNLNSYSNLCAENTSANYYFLGNFFSGLFVDNLSILKILPLFFTAFGFHGSIPFFFKSTTNIKNLKFVFFISSIIALFIYLIWIFLVFSNISLEDIIGKSTVADIVLSFSKNGSGRWISLLVDGFAFFALFTSIIGVGITLIDFFKGKIQNNLHNKIFLKLSKMEYLLIPVTFFSCSMIIIISPYLFIKFLSFAALCLIFIAIIIPCLIIYKQRYLVKNLFDTKDEYFVIGGKISLFFTIIVGLLFILIDLRFLFFN